ncbi:hypothetical protein [Jatrophihabitans sp.]|uniref:hypothetical protein n=1 Tax=Jatrophihabitans sp. TaxID=1932789 RepID=UPI0030C6F2E4|nr:hypothetical protein [Jatrophihabitans sp.]
MIWVPLGVLIGGVVLSAIVFGFGAYELNWKARRLRADLARLEALNERLGGLQSQIAEAQQRLAAAGKS